MSTQILGQCHCGRARLEFRTTRDAGSLASRACACTFCLPRHMRWTSDPSGELSLLLERTEDIARYRFGTETAEFVLCRRCGFLLVAKCEIEDRSVAAINIDALSCAADFPSGTATDFDGESLATRLIRRAKTWTPLRVRVGEGKHLEGAGGHRSRLGQVLIDCNESQWEVARRFWPAALGLEPMERPKDTPRYLRYPGRPGMPDVLLQRVEDDSGFHLDIESDDPEAEVARLEGLGARSKGKVKTWWVMEAPTGHTFCVIPIETASFPEHTNRWPAKRR